MAHPPVTIMTSVPSEYMEFSLDYEEKKLMLYFCGPNDPNGGTVESGTILLGY